VRRSLMALGLMILTLGALGPWARAGGLTAPPTPPPVRHVRPAHRLVALALRAGDAFTAWHALGDVLHRDGAQATLFLTVGQIRRAGADLRALRQAADVELGLAGPSPRGLLADADEAARLLGDRLGVYQPAGPPQAGRLGQQARAAGLVPVLWTRRASRDAARLTALAQSAEPGDILRFDLPDDAAGVRAMDAALGVLRARSLLATSASGLIEDAAEHLEYCSAARAGAAARPSAKARPQLRRLYPAAPLAARALWRLGRPGELAVRRLYGVKAGVALGDRPLGGLLPREVATVVAGVARRTYVAPLRATLGHPDGQVVPDRPGRRLDVPATLARIWAAQPKTRVAPLVRTVYARWRTADIAALTVEVGRYRTWIDGSSGRYMNIQKGAGRINNRIVFPGETFSVLGAIGDVTKQPGWHRAPVIVWGSYAEGVGGGLCQVSSTLYNAVRAADLTIVERHHHAKRVHYVPRGRDATIAWPDLDFRFRNDRATPVVLKAQVRGGALRMAVLGKAEA